MEALEREVTRLQKATPKAAKATKTLGRSAKGAAGGFKALGLAIKSTLAPLAAATATIGGLTAGFRTLAGQDFAAAKVETLGVNSADLIVNLQAVSKELKGNASVAELTASAYDVASAGFTDAADAAKVLQAASLGATGGFSDINTVADAATSVLNAYGQSADDAAKLIDGFIQTQNDGKIVVDQYAQNIGKVASAAAGLKIPIEEINTVIAQSTASGVQAEIAFTGLKGALARLASGEASNSLAAFGIEINSASLEADGLLGTLEKFKDLDTGTILKALGTEAGPALLPVINNLEKAQELLKNQKDAAGAAQAAQERAAATIGGAWNRVAVAFQNLFSDQAALAQAIIPILDAVANAVNGITFALEQMRKVASEVNGLIQDIASTASNAIGAFGGLGDAIKWAADQLGRLLLRADGFESMDKSGWGKGFRNFGANYKEQEAALFAAANGASASLKPLPKVQTKVPTFSPGTSGGAGGADAAAKAAEREAERVAETLRDREQLVARLEQQIKIQESITGLGKEEQKLQLDVLEINQQYDNLLLKETNELIRQNTERARALELDLARQKAQESMMSAAQDDFTGFLKKQPEYQGLFNDELTETEKLLKGSYEIITNSLTSGIKGLIDGTKEWGDILSDIAGQLGSMFLNMGFKMLGGNLGIPGFATGGMLPSDGPAIVGEQGPELVMSSGGQSRVFSNQDSKAAMNRWSEGNAGSVQPPVQNTFKLETTVINGVEYATVAQVQKMGQSATAAGAKQGEQRAMNRLRQSRSTRSQVGI